MTTLETLGGGRNWYALRVRSRREQIVEMHLSSRGYESFLPTYTSRRQWSDRLKQTELPLFPGYVFCEFEASDRFPVLTIPGVVHVVGIGKVPIPVDAAEIAALRAAVQGGLRRQPWPFLQVGDRVKIEHGPLCGVEGILLRIGEDRLVLSVTLLQRSVAVQVDEDWVRPIALAKGATCG